MTHRHPGYWSRRGLIWLNRFRGYGYGAARIRVPIDRSLLSSKVEWRVATGAFEAAEFKATRAIIRPGDTVLELGAGLGVLSAAVRRHTSASRVVVFEPNPDLSDFIRRTHALNRVSDVELRQAVVMSRARTSTVPFYRHPDVFSSSLFHRPRSAAEAIDVPVVLLQEVLAEVIPDILLVDIEGGEVELFEGAKSLGNVDRIVLELHEEIYGADGVLKLFTALCRLGFAYDAQVSHRKFLVLRRRYGEAEADRFGDR